MLHNRTVQEKDNCAIIAFVDKNGRSSHPNIVKTIEALKKMAHRSGDINGEGDGCGVLTDIPRDLWAIRLEQNGLSPHLAESRSFFVAHLLLPLVLRNRTEEIQNRVRSLLKEGKCDLLLERTGDTRDEALGPRARQEAPLFWQVAGLIPGKDPSRASKALFDMQLALEREIPELHIASLSLDSVVYKLRGAPELLPRVYPELMDENCRSVMTLGHGRYSTNTLPTVERAQPFSMLGHNGEINTIERLRSAGRVLNIEPAPGGSDSQDLNRIIEGLINFYGLDLMEAMEMVFPAIHSEVAQYGAELQNLYGFYRWFFPPSAQGPAAVIARHGDLCMGSVDALGLRPLWFGESNYDFFLSSEKGVVDLENTMGDPRPLAPGEKMAIFSGKGRTAEVMDYSDVQKQLLKLMQRRKKAITCTRSLYKKLPSLAPENTGSALRQAQLLKGVGTPEPLPLADFDRTAVMAAFGWTRFDVMTVKRMAATGKPVIGSMGHQGPLACMNLEGLPNLADFFKENVAVVTNPAIDREREAEHFSTRTILGARPDIRCERVPAPVALKLDNPLLLEHQGLNDLVPVETIDGVASTFGTYTVEEVVRFFTAGERDPLQICRLDITFSPDLGLKDRLEALCAEAVEAVRAGSVLVVLDDCMSFTQDRVPVDPGLALAHLSACLEKNGLRRDCGVLVRSGAIRNLHDVMFLLGLGADALCPYLAWRQVLHGTGKDLSPDRALSHCLDVLTKGIEKVMSTMGIHELCGYGRIFASIGLGQELANLMNCPNFCPSKKGGVRLETLEAMGRKRYALAVSDEEKNLQGDAPRNTKVGKILRNVAVGKTGYVEMMQSMEKIDTANPIALRHLLEPVAVPEEKRVTMDKVDISVGNHAMPLVIAAMSFGSQGENSFRAYAEAAVKANIVCMNGEGGEIPDMLGRYRANRGQQIASGRFGVTMALLNSAAFLEIKIGQGAKPGEGGHLPGNKVSAMVAEARHCKPGITLISPSNQHDIYSIEDLMQIVTELKTANPLAKVSVKIPVTSGVGTIAVGVAKAGADVVNISGFEGGTGAAREHAKKFVGLPVEIGVTEAHQALLESGLRDQVEIWADGGLRSGRDVLKMILLGANRCGLGTVALMGVGCISCQRCHLDRCPRGISTQLRSIEEAKTKGVKGFAPRQVEIEAENLARLMHAIGDELRHHLAAIGEQRLQDLVGRTDLLQQVAMSDRVDTAYLLRQRPAAVVAQDNNQGHGSLRPPLNHLTKLISDLAMDRFEQGVNGITFVDEGVRSTDRAIGTYLAGAMVRSYGLDSPYRASLRLTSSVPGNGLCAFNIPGIESLVYGGAQDGSAKGCAGGLLAVLKERNLSGGRVDGSTGKSFAYGAIGGMLIVQNYADSRACVRMSGADVVFGGRITAPVRDDAGNIASRAHLKGFAFEYMTGGRALVLGDPGPWICAGMTGGVIYQCLYPEFYFNRSAIKRRLSRDASIAIKSLDDKGLGDVEELLAVYIRELRHSYQDREVEIVEELLDEARERFVMLMPKPLDIQES